MVYESWMWYIGVGTGTVASFGCWMLQRRQRALRALQVGTILLSLEVHEAVLMCCSSGISKKGSTF